MELQEKEVKRNKKLKHTENLFKKNLQLIIGVFLVLDLKQFDHRSKENIL